MARVTARSEELFQEALRRFPGGVNSPVRAFKAVGGNPFIVSRGEGPYLFDVDGNRYVDYIMSWGPLVLGHAHPEVVAAVTRQLQLGTSYGAPGEPELELARVIQAAMPNLEKIRFVSSGTEAGMSVLRLARAYTGRTKIIKFHGCYHGHADALLVKAGSGVLTLGLPDSPGVPADVASNTLTAHYNDLESVQRLFDENRDQIAAVIVEPVPGNAGLLTPKAGFLEGLREITEQEKALLIFDEVMTGFRVHPGGAQTLYQVRPDLTMLAKVIGGGLPVGAFGGRKEIMSMIAPEGPVYQAGTLSGNPLAMAGGIATVCRWIEGDTFARAERIAKRIAEEFRELSLETGVPIQSASVGTMFGFFFSDAPVSTFADAQRSDLGRFKRFFSACLDRGVYFAPSQFEAGFVSVAHEGEALDYTLQVMKEVLHEMSRE